jgi:hypothetical protein
MAQHPKTDTAYPSKYQLVTRYELPKYFLWNTSTAAKGRCRFKNRILNKSIAYKGQKSARADFEKGLKNGEGQETIDWGAAKGQFSLCVFCF